MSDASSHFSIIVMVIIGFGDLWAVVNVIRSDKTLMVKAAWFISILVLPVLGWIV
jgi:hypothetical protein